MEVQEKKLEQEEDHGSGGDLPQGKEKRCEIKVSQEKDLVPHVLCTFPQRFSENPTS